MLNGLLKQKVFLNWIDTVKSAELVRACKPPQAKLCGLDFNSEELTFKVYLELNDFPTISILEQFFSVEVSKEIFSYKEFWDPSKCSGLGLGFKISTNGSYRNYFHIKFKSSYNNILYPNKFAFLKILGIDLTLLNCGISFEVPNNKEPYKKFYTYIQSSADIKKVLVTKKINAELDLTQIEELELYASPTTFKVNIINNNDFYQIKQSLWNTVPQKHAEELKGYEKEIGSPLLYTGFTNNDTFSCYFSLTNINPNKINL